MRPNGALRVLPRSLFGRLVLIFIGGLLIAQIVSIALGARERSRVLHKSHNQAWAEHVSETVSLLDALDGPTRARVARVLSHPRLAVTLQPAPQVFAATVATAPRVDDLRQQLALTLGPRPFRFDAVANGRGPDTLVTQVRLDDGDWLTFTYTPRPDHRPWPHRLLLALGVSVVAVIVISLIAVRWVTRPLALLARAADALGQDMNRPPLTENGPAEVRGAARAFNRMQARLREHLSARTRLLAAVSHDLKTPITRLRLRAEMLEDETLRTKFARDLQEMEQLADATLDFMRGLDTREPVQPVDVQALVESLQRDHAELGHTISVEGRARTPYAGRPTALRRCLENLVGNALKYGGGAHLRIEDDARRLRLHVLDDGPGISDTELERVFEPFYRLESSRSRASGGSGLGLGIARNIAENHGGRLDLSNRPEGGLDAMVTLPR